MDVIKYEALGNDYLVLGPGADRPVSELVRRLCRPHTGIGADGLLWQTAAAGAFGVRIFNPDGSSAEMSGNGLRIFARALVDQGAAATEASLTLDTGVRRVTARVAGDRRTVAVAMGGPTFLSRAIPLAGPARTVDAEQVALAGAALQVWPVGFGNPHCVVFDRPVTAATARMLGPQLETHPLFPARTNVQFVEIVDSQTVRIEIWERGAGYTLASGSSACAAAVVAHQRGLVGSAVAVQMRGGTLRVQIDEAGVRQTGAVHHVFTATLSAEWLAAG